MEELQNTGQQSVILGKMLELHRESLELRRARDVVGLAVLVEHMQPDIQSPDHISCTFRLSGIKCCCAHGSDDDGLLGRLRELVDLPCRRFWQIGEHFGPILEARDL